MLPDSALMGPHEVAHLFPWRRLVTPSTLTHASPIGCLSDFILSGSQVNRDVLSG